MFHIRYRQTVCVDTQKKLFSISVTYSQYYLVILLSMQGTGISLQLAIL